MFLMSEVPLYAGGLQEIGWLRSVRTFAMTRPLLESSTNRPLLERIQGFNGPHRPACDGLQGYLAHKKPRPLRTLL